MRRGPPRGRDGRRFIPGGVKDTVQPGINFLSQTFSRSRVFSRGNFRNDEFPNLKNCIANFFLSLSLWNYIEINYTRDSKILFVLHIRYSEKRVFAIFEGRFHCSFQFPISPHPVESQLWRVRSRIYGRAAEMVRRKNLDAGGRRRGCGWC